jgi:hypothetical protein
VSPEKMLDTEETLRWNASRIAEITIKLGKNETPCETYSYRLYYYYQQDSINAHIVQAMFKIRIHSIPVVHLPRGIHSSLHFSHHIVRMHIHTHPPISSCTSDLFPFPYPQANTTTTLFTRSTLRDLPSQLGQHAYDLEQH